MVSHSIKWVLAVAVTCCMALPVLAAPGRGNTIPSASFDLKSGARLATTDSDNGDRIHVRFTGEGSAEVGAGGVSIELGTLTQVNGDRTVTVTPTGDFRRRGRSRVFVGWGTATVDLDGVVTSFEKVRIMVKLRGHGDRLRLIGKFRGKNGPHTVDGHRAPPDILRGGFRGQRVVAQPVDE